MRKSARRATCDVERSGHGCRVRRGGPFLCPPGVRQARSSDQRTERLPGQAGPEERAQPYRPELAGRRADTRKVRPLYGVCQGGEMDQRTPLAFFLASFLACFFVRRDVSSSRRHFLPYFASSTESVGRFCPEGGQLLVEADRDIRCRLGPKSYNGKAGEAEGGLC